MAEKSKRNVEAPRGVDRLREEHKKVVKDCDGQIQHWKKVEGDYDALNERLKTLPDQLSYDIMVPFGPLAFMPGKMVHTNEINVLLGDNWFAKVSAKQAQKLVEHRKEHVKGCLDDLLKTRENFEARVRFTEDLEKGGKGDFVDIRETVENTEEIVTKGKRVALKPHSKPKLEALVDMEGVEGGGEGDRDGGSRRGVLSEEELWARLDELEKMEEEQDEEDRRFVDIAAVNGDDSSSSSSSSEEDKEEDKEGEAARRVNGHGQGWKPASHNGHVNGCHDIRVNVNGTALPSNGMPSNGNKAGEEEDDDDEDEEEEASGLPTIYFSHTMEPKKVRINTGKNTTLKFSERKEQISQAKRKKKNGSCNGHSHHEHFKITTPTDIYRIFVDVKNGEPIPRKSILKSRSRENSVCSDTSESSACDFDERRSFMRTMSHDDATHSEDTSDGITEEESPTAAVPNGSSRFEAFSGTVVEKEPLPSSIPHLALAPPALPTIPERRLEEVTPEVPAPPPEPVKQVEVPETHLAEPVKRVSKFKAARLQQK